MEIETTMRPVPPVWNWYVVYCVTMALMYLVIVLLGVLFLGWQLEIPDTEEFEIQIIGWVFLGLGLPLGLIFGIAPFLPKQPWAWIFGIVLIGIGMTSACCLPAAIPLLIFWIKPENKAFFGRT
ncbi:hypothetical protein L0128_23230 [candidate division KSB1 bacterium]|nr:hypothetical protein [candidate division KSB1 bacterium]